MNHGEYLEIISDFTAQVKIRNFISNVPIVDTSDEPNLSTCFTVILENIEENDAEPGELEREARISHFSPETQAVPRKPYFFTHETLLRFLHSWALKTSKNI